MASNERGLGKWMATSLVVGNMIGSGIFLIPASLAAYGGISILGWVFSTIGAISIALVFSYLNKKLPKANGGPYAYTNKAFGNFAGFLVAWGYWNSIWCTNAAIAVALISYLSVFFPILSSNSLAAVSAGAGFILFLSWTNLRPIRNVGYVQLITTILKIIPILIIGIIGLFYIDWQHFEPFNRTGDSPLKIITATTTLTLFAYLGIESATIPQDRIENPESNIQFATLFGTIITAMVYILGSLAVMGIIAPDQLAQSDAPFAMAGELIGGNMLRYFVAIGAIIATFGALNGWILLQGQIPMAAAHDNLFPEAFKKVNKHGAPYFGILFSSGLAMMLMMLNYHKSTIEAFTFMMLLSTLNVLIPYLFSSAANFLLDGRMKEGFRKVIGGFAFGFSIWMVIGCGEEVVYYGFLLLMLGIPFYIWMKKS